MACLDAPTRRHNEVWVWLESWQLSAALLWQRQQCVWRAVRYRGDTPCTQQGAGRRMQVMTHERFACVAESTLDCRRVIQLIWAHGCYELAVRLTTRMCERKAVLELMCRQSRRCEQERCRKRKRGAMDEQTQRLQIVRFPYTELRGATLILTQVAANFLRRVAQMCEIAPNCIDLRGLSLGLYCKRW